MLVKYYLSDNIKVPFGKFHFKPLKRLGRPYPTCLTLILLRRLFPFQRDDKR